MARRRRHLDKQVEEGTEIRAGPGEVSRGRARLRVGVDNREFDLVVVGAKVDEQLVDLAFWST